MSCYFTLEDVKFIDFFTVCLRFAYSNIAKNKALFTVVYRKWN